MKFTKTLQPAHLIPNSKLLKANDAFLAVNAVRSNAILFAGMIDDHTCAATWSMLLLENRMRGVRWKGSYS